MVIINQRCQQIFESVEAYVIELYHLSEDAEFHNRDEAICDRLVLGLRDTELSEKLQIQSKLTLDDAVTMARQHEMVKSQLNEQRQVETADVSSIEESPRAISISQRLIPGLGISDHMATITILNIMDMVTMNIHTTMVAVEETNTRIKQIILLGGNVQELWSIPSFL